MSEISANLGPGFNEPPAILIVDDMPANLGVVVDSLADQGFRVLVALDGVEALERALFSQPDLILLDVKMPGIDGFETCRRLKMNKQTRDISVIFMTSLTGIEDLIEGFAAGGADYVTKPVRIDEMMARIVAKRLVEHLERSGFLIMKKPPSEGAATLGRGFKG